MHHVINYGKHRFFHLINCETVDDEQTYEASKRKRMLASTGATVSPESLVSIRLLKLIIQWTFFYFTCQIVLIFALNKLDQLIWYTLKIDKYEKLKIICFSVHVACSREIVFTWNYYIYKAISVAGLLWKWQLCKINLNIIDSLNAQ